MQFIVDGRTSEVKYPILAEAETPFAIIKARQKQAKDWCDNLYGK